MAHAVPRWAPSTYLSRDGPCTTPSCDEDVRVPSEGPPPCRGTRASRTQWTLRSRTVSGSEQWRLGHDGLPRSTVDGLRVAVLLAPRCGEAARCEPEAED